jgi:hypothetical protein
MARSEKAHQKTLGGFLTDLLHLGAQPGPAAQAYDETVKEVLSRVYNS